MYLAPLNYDIFFRKIFSQTHIAKRFLEDFFDVEIEEIELLPFRHKLTDAAKIIKFDFRCKINGAYIIIEMQQWYKAGIIQRFYMYHAANTTLQLEQLPSEKARVGKDIEVKSYENLLPVRTLIWMVDDSLGFTDDYLMFESLPQNLRNFIENDQIWETADKATLLKERIRLLKLLHNDKKNITFLRQNPIIFAFQQNIVRNKKIEKYVRWFNFAQKTKRKTNQREDFSEFLNDEIFEDMMQKLNQETLSAEGYTVTDYLDAIDKEYELYKQAARIEIRKEMKEEVKAEVKEEVKAEVKEEVKAEVKEEVKAEAEAKLKIELQKREAEIKAQMKREADVKQTQTIIKMLQQFPLWSDAEIAELGVATEKEIALVRQKLASKSKEKI